jgi:hypothetical protein
MPTVQGTSEAAAYDDFVDRLAAYDVTYLTGGNADSKALATTQTTGDVGTLTLDLIRAPEPRLRESVIALLLRHPELAPSARVAIDSLAHDDPSRSALQARLLVAAALQHIWRFVLPLYLPGQPRIDVDDLTRQLGLSLADYEGRDALLQAVPRLMASPHIVDWPGTWEDVADQILTSLRLRGAPNPATLFPFLVP